MSQIIEADGTWMQDAFGFKYLDIKPDIKECKCRCKNKKVFFYPPFFFHLILKQV